VAGAFSAIDALAYARAAACVVTKKPGARPGPFVSEMFDFKSEIR
jgi:hypothetical protein